MEKSIDLSDVENERLWDLITKIFEEYSGIWSGHLGELKSAENFIDLKLGKPHPSNSISTYLLMGDNTAESVQSQLYKWFI